MFEIVTCTWAFLHHVDVLPVCMCVKDEVWPTNSAVWMDFMNMCWTMDMVIMDMKSTDGWLSVSQDASAPNVLDIYPQWSCWVGEAWQAVAGSECVADILLSSMVNRSSKCQKIYKWQSIKEIFRTLWKYMYWYNFVWNFVNVVDVQLYIFCSVKLLRP